MQVVSIFITGWAIQLDVLGHQNWDSNPIWDSLKDT